MIDVDIIRGIKAIEIEGALYAPQKGEEGVNLPDKLGKAMIKRGWAKKAPVTHCKVKGAELKAAAQWIKGTGNISGAKIGKTHINTYFRDETFVWGGKVSTPLVEGTEHTKVIAFDSNRLTRCLWTCKKGEDVDIKIRPSTLEILDKDGRQWLHTLPPKEEMSYIGKTKIKIGSIKLFIEKARVVNLKKAIVEAVKEGKADYTDHTTYTDIALVTEGKNVNIFLYGYGDIKKVYCVYTGDIRGESVAVYPLSAFMTVLKGVKARGKTEGLKLVYDEATALKATFSIGSSRALVYIAGKTERGREEVRKVLNPSSSPAPEEKTEEAFKETEETFKPSPSEGEEEVRDRDAGINREYKEAVYEGRLVSVFFFNLLTNSVEKVYRDNEGAEYLSGDLCFELGDIERIKEEERARIDKAATSAALQLEEEKAREEIDRIQEQERREQEEHKPEEIREGVSFLTVREATGAKFSNSKDVYEDMKPEARIDRECMWVLHLNAQNKVVKKEMVSMGAGNKATVTAREVYRRAIIEGAISVILVHNHPGGDPKPSEADKQICLRLRDAGRLIGINLLDFMVIAIGGYISFADDGMLDQGAE